MINVDDDDVGFGYLKSNAFNIRNRNMCNGKTTISIYTNANVNAHAWLVAKMWNIVRFEKKMRTDGGKIPSSSTYIIHHCYAYIMNLKIQCGI